MTTFAVWLVAASTLGAVSEWWDADVDESLKRAPERVAVWEATLRKTPAELWTGMTYLVTYLPLRDLKEMSPDVLAMNVALANHARAEVPWGPGLPEEIFLDAVLPHASVTEPRESMRAEFLDRYLPLVKDCKTPGEAALRLNRELFQDYKVSYNTRRLRPDQSSRESIKQGVATCTGLSIMLVEACRAVGVPARLAGIRSWPGRGGNHTWVEIWDDGWRFVGAAEPDPAGLDHAWFVADASKAIKDQPRNAIFAVTYKPTGDLFPLVWSRSAQVNAENVTDRYAREPEAGEKAERPRLMVEVVDSGQRVRAQVSAVDAESGAVLLSGESLGPDADINQHLSAPVDPDRSFLIVARLDGRSAVAFAEVKNKDVVARLDLGGDGMTDDARDGLAAVLADRFGIDEAKRDAARKVLAEIPPDAAARDLAWNALKDSPANQALREEFDDDSVSTADRSSPYRYRHVGEKPEGGWALVIAMHGGGGVPKPVNDRQWAGMFEGYYKDNPAAGGYIYLALRAPNDVWNGFYDDAIAPLVERLIRQFVLFGEVNPDKVYITGASHGGYGAFVIGPKVPDRFAAVHASAAAPTPGETRGENLRNTRFTFMVGENDTAYNRRGLCLEFAKELQDWRAKYGGYAGGFEWITGAGHSVPGRDKPAEMIAAATRNPWPNKLVWTQSDDVIRRFYWVEAPNPADDGRIEAEIERNAITLKTEDQDGLVLHLDAPLVDPSRPLTVRVNDGEPQSIPLRPDLETFCADLSERGDPRLAAPIRIEFEPRP